VSSPRCGKDKRAHSVHSGGATIKTRWLGIDYGDKRIGIAISDELQSFAHPFRTLQSDSQLFQEIRKIVEREKVGGVVVGLPKNMDGSLGPSATKAQSFASRLAKELISTKVLLWDERLTTVEAQRALHLAGKNAKQSKKVIDQVAAQILLQNYLDSLQWAQTNEEGEC
jgi:putative holliday junction resolvase